MTPIQLIVGLSNPGKEYANTRHNAGAWFMEEIAKDANVTLSPDRKYHGLHSLIQLHQQACHLLIPTTFMNDSGIAVQACVKYHKIAPEAILVCHDDLDLPVGTIKLKFDGGDGGHNGIKDIIGHLHTKQFHRLRIGIGRPTHDDVINYVLENPSKADRQTINAALHKAYDILPLLMSGEISKATQQLHTNTET